MTLMQLLTVVHHFINYTMKTTSSDAESHEEKDGALKR